MRIKARVISVPVRSPQPDRRHRNIIAVTSSPQKEALQYFGNPTTHQRIPRETIRYSQPGNIDQVTLQLLQKRIMELEQQNNKYKLYLQQYTSLADKNKILEEQMLMLLTEIEQNNHNNHNNQNNQTVEAAELIKQNEQLEQTIKYLKDTIVNLENKVEMVNQQTIRSKQELSQELGDKISRLQANIKDYLYVLEEELLDKQEANQSMNMEYPLEEQPTQKQYQTPNKNQAKVEQMTTNIHNYKQYFKSLSNSIQEESEEEDSSERHGLDSGRQSSSVIRIDMEEDVDEVKDPPFQLERCRQQFTNIKERLSNISNLSLQSELLASLEFIEEELIGAHNHSLIEELHSKSRSDFYEKDKRIAELEGEAKQMRWQIRTQMDELSKFKALMKVNIEEIENQIPSERSSRQSTARQQMDQNFINTKKKLNQILSTIQSISREFQAKLQSNLII